MSTRFDKLKEMVARKKAVVLVAAGTASMTLVQYASAASLNDSISPILTDVAELFTPLLTLIIAAVPIIIAISVIGFILGIFAAILGKLNI
jgi:hypothetical protein